MIKDCPLCGEETSLKLCRSCREEWDSYRTRLHQKSRLMKKDLIAIRGASCQVCGRSEKLSAHHILAIVDGGQSEPENILLVCKDCHTLEHGIAPRRNWSEWA